MQIYFVCRSAIMKERCCDQLMSTLTGVASEKPPDCGQGRGHGSLPCISLSSFPFFLWRSLALPAYLSPHCFIVTKDRLQGLLKSSKQQFENLQMCFNCLFFRDLGSGSSLSLCRLFYDEHWSKHRVITSLDWSLQVGPTLFCVA